MPGCFQPGIHCQWTTTNLPISRVLTPFNFVELIAHCYDVKTERSDVAERSHWIVVDDNSSILEMLTNFLGVLTDARISAFQSAEKALEAFSAAPEDYQLVLTDLEMPGMNGVEFCDQLRLRAPHQKVILVTGNQDAIDWPTAKEFGFSGLLYKPFSLGALEHLLENLDVLHHRRELANHSHGH